jgi:hypothetical protein
VADNREVGQVLYTVVGVSSPTTIQAWQLADLPQTTTCFVPYPDFLSPILFVSLTQRFQLPFSKPIPI